MVAFSVTQTEQIWPDPTRLYLKRGENKIKTIVRRTIFKTQRGTQRCQEGLNIHRVPVKLLIVS